MRTGEGNDKKYTQEGEKTRGRRFSMDAEKESTKEGNEQEAKRGEKIQGSKVENAEGKPNACVTRVSPLMVAVCLGCGWRPFPPPLPCTIPWGRRIVQGKGGEGAPTAAQRTERKKEMQRKEKKKGNGHGWRKMESCTKRGLQEEDKRRRTVRPPFLAQSKRKLTEG
jgi:hypothetical protein